MLEATWSKAGAVVNCAYYLVTFGAGVSGIWKDKSLVPSEHVTTGLVFYLVPVFVIALVDVWLYRKDLSGLTQRLSDTSNGRDYEWGGWP